MHRDGEHENIAIPATIAVNEDRCYEVLDPAEGRKRQEQLGEILPVAV